VTRRTRRPTGVIALILAITGCAHLGPATVVADRFDYNTAIADSWKEQTLLNIVKIRYIDLPIFLDVSSIVTGYSLDTGATVGGQITGVGGTGNHGSASGSVNGTATYSQHPTITYTPMTGEEFEQGLITPDEPTAVWPGSHAGVAGDRSLAQYRSSAESKSCDGAGRRGMVQGVTTS
jgi:hypothetical protein